ncbi:MULTISPECIES: hypothetical protein [Bacillaceae]|uniref:hypothetical protein n=1 Tax=Bacillaceae TaxID=186817 RepID=UPI0026F11BB6|nr:hypothetical protein [Niallia circulans]
MVDKCLWKFGWDTGYGSIEGLFVATEETVANLIGKEVDFGEALGDYSEVEGEIEKNDVVKVDLDPETIAKVTAVLGMTWSGYNPLNYLEEGAE